MSIELKALLIEDVEDDALLLVHQLREEGFNLFFERVDTADSLTKALTSQKWDLVLADYQMPSFDGLSALKITRAHDAELPFIVVSGQIGEELAVELMKAGAQDYVMKNNRHRLVPAIRRELAEADIRRAKRIAEEELCSSEKLFRTLAKVSQVGIFMLSLSTEIIFLNDSGYEILGLSAEKAEGMGWRQAIAEDDREIVLSTLLTAIASEAPFESECSILKKDGKLRWVLMKAMPSKDAQEKTTSYVGTMTDITDLKTQQKNLLRTNRALSILSKCNELAIRAGSEAQLLSEICQTITDNNGYTLVYNESTEIGPDKANSSASKLDSPECINYAPASADTQGPFEPMQGVATSNDHCASAILLPLSHGVNSHRGELKLYDKKSSKFSDIEKSVFEELAADLSLAIQNFRLRDERDKAQLEALEFQTRLRQSLEDALEALATTTELRDPYTAGHQHRVAELSRAIAKELDFSEEKIHVIYLAASVHDIGKIQIPSEILAKPTKLSTIEFELIKTHSEAGYDILKKVDFPWPIAEIVWQHHERLNGSGYPRGLKDGEILREARIIAVADVVEAMASHRPYRAALGIDAALDEIAHGRGSVYEAPAVDACIKLFRESNFQFPITTALQ
jgi:PAS domain S-box-containing protein